MPQSTAPDSSQSHPNQESARAFVAAKEPPGWNSTTLGFWYKDTGTTEDVTALPTLHTDNGTRVYLFHRSDLLLVSERDMPTFTRAAGFKSLGRTPNLSLDSMEALKYVRRVEDLLDDADVESGIQKTRFLEISNYHDQNDETSREAYNDHVANAKSQPEVLFFNNLWKGFAKSYLAFSRDLVQEFDPDNVLQGLEPTDGWRGLPDAWKTKFDENETAFVKAAFSVQQADYYRAGYVDLRNRSRLTALAGEGSESKMLLEGYKALYERCVDEAEEELRELTQEQSTMSWESVCGGQES